MRTYRSTASAWCWCGWQVIVGITASVAVIFISMMALVEVVYFWAIPAGSMLALAVWIVTVIVTTVIMRFRGWNPETIAFLAGFGLLPCYLGITEIIQVSMYGWGNPLF